jgi:hypothetical protein
MQGSSVFAAVTLFGGKPSPFSIVVKPQPRRKI